MEDLNPLDRDFIAALAYTHEFSASFPRKEQEVLNGLEKQATYGDCRHDLTMARSITNKRERKDVEAWIRFKGISPKQCKELYISQLRKVSSTFDPDVTIVSNPVVTDMYRRKLFASPENSFFSPAQPEQPKVDKRLLEAMKRKNVNRSNRLAPKNNRWSKEDIQALQKETQRSIKIGRQTFNQVEGGINTDEDDDDSDDSSLSNEFLSKKQKQKENFGSYMDPPPPPPPYTPSMLSSENDLEERVLEQEDVVQSQKIRAKAHSELPRTQVDKDSYKKRTSLSERPSRNGHDHYINTELDTKETRADSSQLNNPKLTRETTNSEDYKVIYDQVRRFYQKHKPEMLKKGFDRHVRFAQKKGIRRLNEKLIGTYGEGLPQPLNPSVIQEINPSPLLEELNVRKSENNKVFSPKQKLQKKKSRRGKSRQRFDVDEANDKADVFLNDDFLKTELKKREEQQEETVAKSREFKKRLTLFLLDHEPDRIDRCLVLMTKFAEKHGVVKLNEELKKSYKDQVKVSDLIKKKEAKQKKLKRSVKGKSFRVSRTKGPSQPMSPRDAKMLALFFAKNDPTGVEADKVEAVKRWANVNGMASLNRQLKRRYKEDLDEFIFSYEKLKEEIIEFYKFVDQNKIKGIEKIMRWVTLNGRDTLNAELQRRYNIDLDSPTSAMGDYMNKYVDF